MFKAVITTAVLLILVPAAIAADAPETSTWILVTQALPENVTTIDLKIEGAGPATRMSYKIDGGDFTRLGEDLQSSFLSTDTAGGFQGVTLGMFAHNQQSLQQ